MLQKKSKNFKAISAILGHSKPKIYSVGQPMYFSASTTLKNIEK